MSRLVLDTGCLVAAVCSWHEHHEPTREALEDALERGYGFVAVAHALTEAYSVLTRLPPPHRLSPGDAFTVLKENWGEDEAVALTATEYWDLLHAAQGAGISGGLLYDAVIAACAKKAQADVIMTWNVDHLSRVADRSVRVVSPPDISDR